MLFSCFYDFGFCHLLTKLIVLDRFSDYWDFLNFFIKHDPYLKPQLLTTDLAKNVFKNWEEVFRF